MSAIVRVSQIGAKRPGVVTIESVIHDKDGVEVSRGARELPSELFQSNRIVAHPTRLPLADLEPGEYLLSVEARAGSLKEQTLMRFAVQPRPIVPREAGASFPRYVARYLADF
jgi:hypothetical protein